MVELLQPLFTLWLDSGFWLTAESCYVLHVRMFTCVVKFGLKRSMNWSAGQRVPEKDKLLELTQKHLELFKAAGKHEQRRWFVHLRLLDPSLVCFRHVSASWLRALLPTCGSFYPASFL